MRQSTQRRRRRRPTCPSPPSSPTPSDKRSLLPSEFSSAANVEESNFSAPKTASNVLSPPLRPPFSSFLRSFVPYGQDPNRRIEKSILPTELRRPRRRRWRRRQRQRGGVNGTICQPAALNHPREEGQYRRVARREQRVGTDHRLTEGNKGFPSRFGV